MAFNKVMLHGNLGKDPELKTTTAGKSYCRFSMATTEKWKDANGTQQSKTEWHNCVCWGKRGEALANHFKKGSPIIVFGKIEYTEGTKNVNGTDIKIMYTQIRVDEWDFAGKNEGGGYSTPEPTPSGYQEDNYSGSDNNGGASLDDDVPF